MITLYSFRSFFFGRASDVHREGYAHRMTGHGGYLPQYDRMSDEKRLDWFLKLEPELTINDEERQEILIKEQDNKIAELEQRNETIKDMQSQIDKLFEINHRQNEYLKRGIFPEVEINGNKKMIKYQSLNELEKVQNEN
jgi:hypothetical protein